MRNTAISGNLALRATWAWRIPVAFGTLLLLALAARTAPAAVPAEENPAAVPTARDEGWQRAHVKRDQLLQQSHPDMLLIGDSITAGWAHHQEVLQRIFGDWNVAVLGHPADKTQNILWRIENHHFAQVLPRVAVVMAGTNNSNGDEYSIEQMAGGIEAIVRKLREKLPQTKVLLLHIFPRGNREQRVDKGLAAAGRNPQWEKNDQASRLAARIADGQNVVYLDISAAFLDQDGKLSREVMPDLLHPGEKGYEIWGQAMMPTVERMLGARVPNHDTQGTKPSP